MKIKSMMLRNFALVTEIVINFSDSVTYLCGINGAGKSTIGFSAIWFMFKGLAQKGEGLIAERFRFIGPNGKSANGTIKIQDDKEGVTHTVTRKLLKNKTELKIKSSDGKERGQEFLDSLFSAILINPMHFSQMSGKEQALALGIDTSEFDQERKNLEQQRLLTYQEVKRLKGLADSSLGAEKVEAVSLSGLLEQRKEIENFNSIVDEKAEAYQTLLTRKEAAKVEVNRLMVELKKAQVELKDAKTDIDKFEVPPNRQDLKEIDGKIAGAEEVNTKARAYEQSLQDQRNHDAERAKYDGMTDKIATVDTKRLEYIQAQKPPFSNITIEDGEFRLDGKPFKAPYFSTGECLKLGSRLGAKIAEREDRKLDYVYIPHCQDIDEKNRDQLFKDLVSQGFQVCAEIVDTKKQTKGYSVLLHEMEVVGEPGEAGNSLS